MLSLEIESVDRVELIEKKIFITLTYLSTQIDPTNDKRITKKDTWTFEKNIYSKDPNWLQSST